MADPIPPLPVAAVVVGLVVVVDLVARRAGAYDGTEAEWPELRRVRRAPVDADRPYRAAAPAESRAVIAGGVPAAVSVPTLLAGLLAALWSLAFALGFGDLPSAFAGRRALLSVLASIAWCGLRAAGGWALVGAASFQQRRAFAVAAGVVAAMDAALACLPVPCSDVRADDVSVAKAGLAVTVGLALGFGLAVWRRRATLPTASLRQMS